MNRCYIERIESLVERVENWEKLSKKPLVSVRMVTYNHEKYIDKAVQSILMQQTKFEYELLIAEDKSTDRTREIVLGYQQENPSIIRLRLAKVNLFSLSLNPSIGNQWNCRGKYIAILEGDDYWTDPKKLQKQVDFLEAHPEFVICAHNTQRIFEDDPEREYYMRPDASGEIKDEMSIQDIIRSVYSFHTSSIVYRKVDMVYPWYLQKVMSGDIALTILLAEHGKVKYLDEVMSVWRRHAGGITVLENHGGVRLLRNRLWMNRSHNASRGRKYTEEYKIVNQRYYDQIFRKMYCRDREPLRAFVPDIWSYIFRKDSSPFPFHHRLACVWQYLRVRWRFRK
jgi:glycosyltransferase involved in cell wall biosynthesis